MTLNGLGKALDGISEMVSGINPYSENMNEKTEEVIQSLAKAGLTVEEFEDILDTPKSMLMDEYNLEVAVAQRLAQAKASARKKTVAA